MTHEAVRAAQQEGETIDDTLRRVLGLAASPDDLDRGIAAYLDDRQRDQVDQLVSFIGDLGEFEETVEEGGGLAGRDVLRFVAPDSGLTVATVECSEDGYTVCYRDQEGELESVFGSVYDGDEADMDDLKERTRECVEGALRRWGRTNRSAMTDA